VTPEDHNKTLAIAHIVYGAFHLLIISLVLLLFGGIIVGSASHQREFAPLLVFGIFFGFMFLFYLLITLPSFVAGYGLLKRKRWAKTASIVAAVMESMGFPFGTALCVYSLWFSFGDAGKSLYDPGFTPAIRPVSELNPSGDAIRSDWYKTAGTETESTLPRQPPNWRG
jgi:hypothetical protein